MALLDTVLNLINKPPKDPDVDRISRADGKTDARRD